MNKINIGVLAHVDAGKTTLAEMLLYITKSITSLGRVDKASSFLDYNELERNKGITITTKTCKFDYQGITFNLLDTPGHSDFSYELEHVLKVLDYCILIINAHSLVNSQTKLLYKLLEMYQVKTYIFVNKMDSSNYSEKEILANINDQLSDKCLELKDIEKIALINDDLLNEYSNTNIISDHSIKELINTNTIYPIIFGSALKNINVSNLLDTIIKYHQIKETDNKLQAYIYQITNEDCLLVHLKVFSGSIKVKQIINNQKVDQIRVYNGKKYEVVNEVFPNDICAIKGLDNYYVGDIIGDLNIINNNYINSYMEYEIVTKEDSILVYKTIKEMNHENTTLNIHLDDDILVVSLMGEIHLEVFKLQVSKRYNIDIEFKALSVKYKESILDVIEGVGHYEPKGHYAEIHVKLEYNKQGIVIKNDCLNKKTYFEEVKLIEYLNTNKFYGVINNSELDNIKISLLSIKTSSITSFNDLVNALKMAIRNGLKKGLSTIIEPYYAYKIETNKNNTGSIIFDLDKLNVTYNIESLDLDIIKGEIPIRKYNEYLNEFRQKYPNTLIETNIIGYQSYQDEFFSEYNSELDTDNPTGSIFFKNGNSFYVTYDKVHEYMHDKYQYKIPSISNQTTNKLTISDEEVKRVFNNTYKTKPKVIYDKVSNKEDIYEKVEIKFKEKLKELVIIDGYNLLFGLNYLKELVNIDYKLAKDKLINDIYSYQALNNNEVIVVFDAYKVNDQQSSDTKGKVTIVYTKQNETADIYIQKKVFNNSDKYHITVVSNDNLIQLNIASHNAYRKTVLEFENEIKN